VPFIYRRPLPNEHRCAFPYDTERNNCCADPAEANGLARAGTVWLCDVCGTAWRCRWHTVMTGSPWSSWWRLKPRQAAKLAGKWSPQS
jgi:hypothetical protein